MAISTLGTQGWMPSRLGWVNFDSSLSTLVWGPDDTITGGTASADIVADPADASGRECLRLQCGTAADIAQLDYQLGFVRPGDSVGGTTTNPNGGINWAVQVDPNTKPGEIVLLAHLYVPTPSGGVDNDKFNVLQLYDVSGTAFIATLDVQRVSGAWTRHRVFAGQTSATNPGTGFIFDAWTTLVVHYKLDSTGSAGDGFLRIYQKSGIHLDAYADVINDSPVTLHNQSGTTTRGLGQVRLQCDVTTGTSIGAETYWATLAASTEQTSGGEPTVVLPFDPFISGGATDYPTLGQLRDVSDTEAGFFAYFPAGAYKNGWTAVKFRVQRQAPGGDWSSATSGSWSADIDGTTGWGTGLTMTGLSADTTSYEFRVQVKQSTDTGNTDVVSGPTLSYTAPTGSVKALCTHCLSHDGRAQPYNALQEAVDAGCKAFFILDDIGYYDDGPGNIFLSGTYSATVNGMRAGLLQIFTDPGFVAMGQTGPVYLKPGDHNFEDDMDWTKRANAKSQRATQLWEEWVVSSQLGFLDPNGHEFHRAFGWGDYLLVFPDDVTARDPVAPGDDSLIGSTLTAADDLDAGDGSGVGRGDAENAALQKSQLKAAWDSTSKRLIVICPVRVNGAKEGNRALTSAFLLGSDNWGYEASGGSPTFWAEWDELIDDIASDAPSAKVLVLSGDRHYLEVNKPAAGHNDLGTVIAECTMGPAASVNWKTALEWGGDFADNAYVADNTTRLAAYMQTPPSYSGTPENWWNTNYGILTLNGQSVGIAAFEAGATISSGATAVSGSVSVGGGGGFRSRGRGGRGR